MTRGLRAWSSLLLLSLLLLALLALLPAASSAQGARRTAPQKVADAMSAGPATIARAATVMDWPDSAGGAMRTLRTGTNGWVCYPTTPGVHAGGNDPMCMDAEFQRWGDAWMHRVAPQPKSVGVAYMLRGDAGTSNTDPFATARTADNSWIVSGPHVMVIVPDSASLAGISADPKNGGPWVMWKGTPYAHIMVPVQAPRTR